MACNIFEIFYNSKNKFGRNTALVVEGQKQTYNELFRTSTKISSILKQFNDSNIGIFGSRSLTCYQGILGTLCSGKTYIPINPNFPIQRSLSIIKSSKIKTLIIDRKGLNELTLNINILNHISNIICPEVSESEVPSQLKNKYNIFTSEDIIKYNSSNVIKNENSIAYILFTSGSTGEPKGVPIKHENVYSYVNYLFQRFKFIPSDRFSQTFELTFDVSIHDMFMAWSSGASLYVIPKNDLIAPAKFIIDNKITVWYSVPSLALMMKKLRLLKANNFPSLRYSLFCGEALPKSIVVEWQKCAPNSTLGNIYGPTEVTQGISYYEIPADEEKILTYNEIVSIGKIFENHDYCMISEDKEITEYKGELCIAGPQVFDEYYNNINKTESAFINFANDKRKWYRTGDYVMQLNGYLYFISRVDHQVKVRGNRIELDEINIAIKKYSNCNTVYTIPYPIENGVAKNLYSFMEAGYNNKRNILSKLKEVLPDYMVPKDIIFIEEFPQNLNGKIDLKALTNYIN